MLKGYLFNFSFYFKKILKLKKNKINNKRQMVKLYPLLYMRFIELNLFFFLHLITGKNGPL